jgi:hypothetical protein
MNWIMWNSKKEEQKITWLKQPEDVPKWLNEIFKSKSYEDRMSALKKINQESILVDVNKN